MLKLEALSVKLQEFGVTAAIFLNALPTQPPYVVSLTEFPGKQTELDGHLDVPSVQVICRGEQLDNQSARDLAHQVDNFFLDELAYPYDLAGSRVMAADRLGGGPGFFGTDEENRTTYVCNYWIKLER